MCPRQFRRLFAYRLQLRDSSCNISLAPQPLPQNHTSQCVIRRQLDGLLRQRLHFLKLLPLDVFRRYPEPRPYPKRRDFLTSPTFCISFNGRVYLTAIGRDNSFGTTGLQAAEKGGL